MDAACGESSFERPLNEANKDAAQTELKVTVKALDRAAAKGIIHKNAAARTKSRLNKAVKEIAA